MASSVRTMAAGPVRAALCNKRGFHSSSKLLAVTKFSMPAMSPTMTEGGLASWKVKEGDTFAAGDVLLEIETDKATMDVEAQEDGIMAKIVVGDGSKNVPVGKTIAMLAEEGDDISSVEVPAEKEPEQPVKAEGEGEKPSSSSSSSSSSEASSSSASSSSSHANKESTAEAPESRQSSSEAKRPPPTKKTMMPSVLRLMADFKVSSQDADSIHGTGLHGMLTKGDVLAHLGKARSPTGTFKEDKRGISAQGGAAAPKTTSKSAEGDAGKTPADKKSEPLTAGVVRSMILSGLASASHATRTKELAAITQSPPLSVQSRRSAFDDLLDDYQFKSHTPLPSKEAQHASQSRSDKSFQGLL